MKPTDVSYQTSTLYRQVVEATRPLGGKVAVVREGWVQVKQDYREDAPDWVYNVVAQLDPCAVQVEAKATGTQRLDRSGRQVQNLVVNFRLQETRA